MDANNYSIVRVEGIFDDSSEELFTRDVREHVRVSEIYYLKDGRYIRRTSDGGYELFDAEDKLVSRVVVDANTFLEKHKDARFILFDMKTYRMYVLDLEEKKMERFLIEGGLENQYNLLSFGKDINTLFCYDRYKMTTVYELRYYMGKWHLHGQPRIISDSGNINNRFFDGENTLFIAVQHSNLKMHLFSFNVSTMEVEHIRHFDQCNAIKFIKMLTPSILVLNVEGTNHTDNFLFYDASTGVMTESKINVREKCFTPDGRSRISPKYFYLPMHAISDDGQRMDKYTCRDGPMAELRFAKPMLHPISTYVYGTHRWIRLMSDGTVERIGVWPAFGKPLRETLLSEVEPEARLAVIIWRSLTDIPSTFEEAKRGYLGELMRAIAKVVISIK